MEEQDNRNTPVPKQRKIIVAGGFALLFIALVGATLLISYLDRNTTNTAQNKVVTVQITKDGFNPATTSVPKGTKVIWTNEDQTLHQIAANPFPKGTDLRSLKSEILNNAQSYTYTATTTGTFGYHDQLHPTINGTLVVKKP